MIIFVLREGAHDTGTAFPKLRDAAQAAKALKYAEIIRADLAPRGIDLHCALFNRQLGKDAKIVAVVHDGKVMILNQKLAPQQAYSCPDGHVRGVVAPSTSELTCGVCQQPLVAG